MAEEIKKEEESKQEEVKEEAKEKEMKVEMKEEVKEEKKEEPKPEPKAEVKTEIKEEKKAPVAKASEDKKEKPVKVPAKFKKLVEEIGKMTVLDLAELVKILEKKFGVSSVAPVVAAVAPGAVPGGAQTSEKSVFNIVLTAIGDKKIEVIKAVRDVTQKGLKDSKDLVDASITSPQTIKENVKKKEAEEMKKKFEAAGAKVELK